MIELGDASGPVARVASVGVWAMDAGPGCVIALDTAVNVVVWRFTASTELTRVLDQPVSLSGDGGRVSLSVAPSCTSFLAFGASGSARRSLTDGGVLARLPDDGHTWVGGAWSPDERRIAMVAADGLVRIADVDGRPIADLLGHRGRVSDARFSPDGRSLFTAGWDGQILRHDLMVLPPVE